MNDFKKELESLKQELSKVSNEELNASYNALNEVSLTKLSKGLGTKDSMEVLKRVEAVQGALKVEYLSRKIVSSTTPSTLSKLKKFLKRKLS